MKRTNVKRKHAAVPINLANKSKLFSAERLTLFGLYAHRAKQPLKNQS